MIEWQPIETAPEGIIVRTLIADGSGPRNFQELVRRANLWWLPDGSMYVYYQPTHWCPAEKETG